MYINNIVFFVQLQMDIFICISLNHKGIMVLTLLISVPDVLCNSCRFVFLCFLHYVGTEIVIEAQSGSVVTCSVIEHYSVAHNVPPLTELQHPTFLQMSLLFHPVPSA